MSSTEENTNTRPSSPSTKAVGKTKAATKAKGKKTVTAVKKIDPPKKTIEKKSAKAKPSSKKVAPKDKKGKKDKGKKVSASSKKSKAGKEEKPKKDPNAPKRPTTAFLYFSTAERETMKKENPGMKGVEIAKALGAKWNELSPEQKKPYLDLYDKDKLRFMKEKEAYTEPADAAEE